MAPDTRKALAEAAAHEILAQGYAGASMSAIAARLGLTKGALAHHYRAKADFARELTEVARAATRQAGDFSRAAYPDCGGSRLLLHFYLLSQWHKEVPTFAAGLALFGDSAAPTFESEDVIGDWLTISIESFEGLAEQGKLNPSISPLEAAEFFVAANLGAFHFRSYVRRYDPGTHPLRFQWQSLAAVGHPDAEAQATEIIDRYHGSALPQFQG